MTIFSAKSKKISERILLKIQLVSNRGTYFRGNSLTKAGKYPVCPICKFPIAVDPDMHEALITKGMVRHNKNIDMINSRFNCVLRHNQCPDGTHYHTSGAGSWEEYKACVKNLISFEGAKNVANWLQSMDQYFPNISKDAMRKFQIAYAEILLGED